MSANHENIGGENQADEREILDKAGAAQLLIISRRGLDDWMRKKRIPYCKLPSGAVRFRRSQLLEFVAKFEVSA